MDGNQLGAVRKGGFDLDIGDHFWYAVHDLLATQDMPSFFHQRSDAFAVASALHYKSANQGHGFGIVKFQAAGQTTLIERYAEVLAQEVPVICQSVAAA